MASLKKLNKWLHAHYGEDVLHRPRFRISWSDDQTELRKGFFNDFYNDILIRRVKEVREVKKYEASMPSPRWVLEQILFYDSEEIPRAREGSYEPVWTFQTGTGAYLPLPSFRILEFMMNTLMYGERLKKGDYDEREAEEKRKEIAYFEDYLEDKSSYIQSMLHEGEAVAPKDKVMEGSEINGKAI